MELKPMDEHWVSKYSEMGEPRNKNDTNAGR